MIHRLLILLIASALLWNPTTLSAQTDDATNQNVTIHVVQRGETLYTIAVAYGLTVADLAQINGITNINNIKAGQRLIITAGQEPASPISDTHIIQPGETLRTIASLYGTTVEDLMSLNDITNPNVIYSGQVISIVAEEGAITTPPTDTPTPSPEPTATDAPVAVAEAANSDGVSIIAGEPMLHTVAYGETLYRIATQYGMTVTELVRANGIVDPTRIFAGQQIIIPSSVETSEAVELPQPLADLLIKPLIFVEGETSSVQVITSSPAQVTVSFMDKTIPTVAHEDGTIHTALIGIPMFVTPDIYPMTITAETSTTTENFTFNVRVITGRYGAQNINIDNTLNELLAPAVDEYEIDLLTGITSKFNAERYFDGPFSLPAAAAMNSPFGTRRSYNGGPVDRYHNGADFASAPGAPIYAAAPGRVVLSDLLNIRGNAVVLDHGWGVYTTYSHMTERMVAPGDFVQTGEIIGTAGSTGRITGPHLHWEVWVHGVPVNPLEWTRTSFP